MMVRLQTGTTYPVGSPRFSGLGLLRAFSRPISSEKADVDAFQRVVRPFWEAYLNGSRIQFELTKTQQSEDGGGYQGKSGILTIEKDGKTHQFDTDFLQLTRKGKHSYLLTLSNRQKGLVECFSYTYQPLVQIRKPTETLIGFKYTDKDGKETELCHYDSAQTEQSIKTQVDALNKALVVPLLKAILA